MNWTLEEAVILCTNIEQVCPKAGCHVALTGGTLYKQGTRKDLDILFYRIRSCDKIDEGELFKALSKIGIERLSGFGWCVKGRHKGKPIDMFFPEELTGDYDPEHELIN